MLRFKFFRQTNFFRKQVNSLVKLPSLNQQRKEFKEAPKFKKLNLIFSAIGLSMQRDEEEKEKPKIENITNVPQVASIPKQLLSDVIDFIFINILLIFLTFPFLYLSDETAGKLSLIISFADIIYYGIKDLLFNGQSIGKKLLNLKVVKKNNQPITLVDSILRNSISMIWLLFLKMQSIRDSSDDYIDQYDDVFKSWKIFLSISLGFLFLVDLIMMNQRKEKRGMGDLMAGTKVIQLDE